MNPADRWQRLQEIFEEARRLPEEARDLFLDSQCGTDTTLRDEVVSILHAHQDADAQFIEPLATEEPLAEVGPYRILGVLGEGGMGTVYAAEQQQPLQRKVALKVIKAGMDTKQVLARFNAEYGALNILDHPGIARIYDAGATERGRPYFVMEYVPGVPINDYCDRERLDTRQRLDLFRSVCVTVQHAHQKGIIHRDLKPSNILVTLQDGVPAPKIIDFGVAKATAQQLTDQTLFTEAGQMLGTPEYMSPEQAEMTGLDIDTRTDVYSLGVLLYELLTGALPFDPKMLRSEGYARIQQIIREVDPPRPSTRVSTAGARAESGGPAASAAGSASDAPDRVAQSRRTDLRTLARSLRGELDWIIMKAIAKERDRRYDSASELAADVTRYLGDEAVVARPPSRVYVARKFVKRHRTGVLSTALIFLALGLGLVGIYREYRKAEDARREIVRLADIKRLQEYREAAEKLWPSHPDKIEALQDWLDKLARPLAGRLPWHEATLERLRGQALPYDEEQRTTDRDTHPAQSELARARAYNKYLQEQGPDAAEERTAVAAQIAKLEESVAERRTWRFPDAEIQWQHDALMTLVSELRSFSDPTDGTIADVERRLEFAQTIEERSITGPEVAAAWATAVRDVAQLPIYGGQLLRPQMGLVPLRRDGESGLWEFWHVQSGTRPQPRDDGWEVTEETGVVLVLVPAGKFLMGQQQDDEGKPGYCKEARPDQSPVHEVTLDAFFQSKYELTQGQWLRVSGENPSYYHAGKSVFGKEHTLAHPVEHVSWKQCKKQLRRLGLRLPTEAQWEYSTRAGTTTRFWFGAERADCPKQNGGNFADAWTRDQPGCPPWGFEPWPDGWGAHAPVGTFAANPWGLHDTHGNVWEWCEDGYGLYMLPVASGNGRRDGTDAGDRILRGGAFINLCTVGSAYREAGTPELVDQAIGLRPSRPLDAASVVAAARGSDQK
ncbi:MAG: SUMF1/EgtB/PvdO family nonheme iron enzyme [Planctomycetota bacterium]